MCGIAGIVDLGSGGGIPRALLERMNEVQVHRGPDEQGIFVDDDIGFAHRRLAIIDLADGQQPMLDDSGRVVLVYNGEIYNHREIASRLRARGHRLRTHCDTEVVLYAWKEWGPACVDHFNGMFAFALWDADQRCAFLARDRLGIKPLYYAVIGGQLVFASELKSLQVHPGFSARVDPRAVEDFFAFGYVPDPKTIFENVYKLPAGYRLLASRNDGVRTERYWDVRFAGSGPIGEDDAAVELKERLLAAVEGQLMSEVPLGAFLSGGVDSSAVVASMARLSAEPVNTCSISFGDPAYNESKYARLVAERYRTSHVERQVDPDDFSLLDTLASIYDEPFADSSAIPTYRVCQLARERVTVALSGDGGDENFAGYRRYRWHLYEERVRSLLPQWLRGPLFGLAGAVYPKADWAPKVLRAKSTFQALAKDRLEGYLDSLSIAHEGMRRAMFSKALRRELDGYSAVDVLREHGAEAPRDDPIARAQYIDLKTYLPGDILTKVDRASMAHSLEVRVPILDHTFVEWAAGLSTSLKFKNGSGKYILKRALEEWLPGDVLYRPKMGFAVPISSWFRGPLYETVKEAVLGERLRATGYFDDRFLEQTVERHRSGLRDNGAVLWSLLIFDAFLKRSIAS